MMKKASIILLGVMLALTGCSTIESTSEMVNNNIREEKNAIAESNNDIDISDTDISDSDISDSDTEYIGNTQLSNLTNFSEERALVQFTDFSKADAEAAVEAITGDEADKMDYLIQNWDYSGYQRVALIDKQGKILWKSELARSDNALEKVIGLRNGLACFVFNGNEKRSYVIIDFDGNVTFTKECSEDFIILGVGDGLFLTAEHVLNFDTDEWRIGTIDKNGNTVAAYKAYEIIDTLPSEPAVVESPSDFSSELEDISDELSRMETEYQAWVEECWDLDYRGVRDSESYQKDEEYLADYYSKHTALLEKKQELEAEYQKQLEKYEEYQQALARYEEEMYYYTPKKISFNMNSGSPDYCRSCEYLGENIYKLNFEYGFVILNMDQQNIISSCDYPADKQFITGFENGTAIVLYNTPADMENLKEAIHPVQFPTTIYSVCSMETDGTLTPIVTNVWAKYVLPDILLDSRFSDGLVFVPYLQGSDTITFMDKEYYAMTGDSDTAYKNGFTLYTGVYYNIEGEVVIDFPEYRGSHEYACSSFCGGYALMMIKGIDQLTYFTIIDKDGNFMFEPITGFEDAYISEDGKYLIALKEGSLTAFDVKGNPLTSVSSINIVPDTSGYFYTGAGYNLSNGMLRFGGMNEFYVNIEDGRIIGSTYFTADDLSVIKH